MRSTIVPIPQDGSFDFFAYIFVAFIVLVIGVIIIKKIKSRAERKKEYPEISACKYKVVKKRSYGKRIRESDIKSYYIDCEDSMGRVVEFRIKEWQFYDIDQGEYIWVIRKYGILSEIGRASTKN